MYFSRTKPNVRGRGRQDYVDRVYAISLLCLASCMLVQDVGVNMKRAEAEKLSSRLRD
jgi:hypothetical protein